jgi:hypothetical protein
MKDDETRPRNWTKKLDKENWTGTRLMTPDLMSWI